MSEYQYYEFQAIDRPLSADDIAYIRSLSRRVQPTPTHAAFTYSYGDFPGNALQVLIKYYDAMLYLANWGSRQLAFRFPHAALDLEALKPYVFDIETVDLTTTKQHAILDISFYPEGSGGEWIEGEGILTGLLPLRDDLLRSDYRVLYLAWLHSIQDGYSADEDEDDEDDAYDEEEEDAYDEEEEEEDEDEDDADEPRGDTLEPPVPPGLGQLSPALRAFSELFGIDEDLIAAAAQASPPLKPVVDEPVEQWVELLSPTERSTWLVRVVRGEPGVSNALLRRLRELGGGRGHTASTAPRRSIDEIRAIANQAKRERKEQQRREAEQAKQRKLNDLAKREATVWKQVKSLIDQKHVAAYDQAVALLIDLRDLAVHQGQSDQFKQRVSAIATEYARRPALLERLRKQRLLS